jgi:heparanase
MRKQALWVSTLILLGAASPGASSVTVAPEKLPKLATVDERFQSYNVEMAELTGGQFWKPYEQMTAQSGAGAGGTGSGQSSGADFYARLKEKLDPVDLANARLRKLAAALGPVFVRSSGNVADDVYFHDSDEPPPATPPKGFSAVLTRRQWKGLVDFARAVNAKIVTSFAVSSGTRDASGRWTPDQARKLLDYTKSIGGSIAAADFMNEPTLAPQGIGGLPKGYSAPEFARDFAIFRPVAKSAAPEMLLLGPSGTGEGPIKMLQGELLTSEDLLSGKPRPAFDAFSYHMYGASSLRCKSPGKLNTTAEAALGEEWLSRTEKTYGFYAGLRNRLMPGKPMWVTETGETSCGGDPWAKTFLDTFRYLDQLGRMARHGVQTVMHNTLDVSEYGLLDHETHDPRPNYWAAVLWHRLMGTTVLDSGVPIHEGMHVYAHCTPGHPGAVTLLAINNSRTQPTTLQVSKPAERYTLAAKDLEDTTVQLNGEDLAAGRDGSLPELRGARTAAGAVTLAPKTVTYLAMAEAGNASCR